MRSDFELLGEAAVYPGHPVTIAYCIVRNFDSLKVASDKGKTFPGALESNDIPGAGGCVYSALDFLRKLASGMGYQEAVDRADATWGRTDNMRGAAEGTDEHERFTKGQAQADRLKDQLRIVWEATENG